MADPLILGTRGSQLALWQAHHARDALEAQGHAVELDIITTTGDRELGVLIHEIGDEAVFTKELDQALLGGHIHFAVHSLKDVPSRLPDGLALAAVSAREVPLDAFVAHPSFAGGLADLPEGATLATASLRRKAMLLAWRPDLRVVPVRGNVDSRLAKLDASGAEDGPPWHGMVLATAGLVRMDLAERITERIDPAIMTPAVGQGALGLACRTEDDATAEALRTALHDEAAHVAVTAERAFLRRVGAGCQVPLGAWARLVDDEGGPRLVLDACIASLDGADAYRGRRATLPTPDDAEAAGTDLADDLLDAGGRAILEHLREQGTI
jgi:hydroxymethylbilane synthase